MDLTMLGTGNALVTECYNTCFVIRDGRAHFMVDGGGGNAVLRQLRLAGLNWRDMRDIFVTHRHIDHLLGVLWMVRMICYAMHLGEYEGEARIYGHGEVLSLLRGMAGSLLTEKETRFIGDRLRLAEVRDGERLRIIGREVTFFDILSTKAKQYGFCMDLGGGEKLTCCGDEPCAGRSLALAGGSRWLLHEAFCLSSQAELYRPYEIHHSTVKDACLLAERLGVQNLLLYHTEDSALPERKQKYRAEGARYYHGNLVIPDDLETIPL